MPDSLSQIAGVKSGAKPPCVLITVRDFSTIRNLLTREAVEYMTSSGLTFVILCDDPGDPFLREHLSHPCFRFEKLRLDALENRMRASRIFEWLRLVRFHTYGNSTPNSLGTRRYHAYVFKEEILGKASFPFGKLFFGTVIPAAHMASRWKWFRRGLVALEGAMFKFEAHGGIYQRYRPVITVVPSLGYAHDVFLMREARRHGARILSIIRSWDNTTNKGYGGCTPDHVFAWNNLMREEAVRHHDVPADRVEVAGIPHWDVYFRDTPMRSREEFFAHHSLSPDRKTIYYAMSGPNSFRKNVEIIELLLQAIRDGRIEHSAQLLVRIHPGFVSYTRKWMDQVEHFRREIPRLKAEYGDLLGISDQAVRRLGNVEILDPINQVLNKEIFSNVDVLVNIYSTQMVEGAIFDLPIITAGWHPLRNTDKPISVFEEYDHVRRVLATGAVSTTHSPEALIETINADLADRPRLAPQRKALVEQEITHFRGDAGLNSAKRIAALARQ
jgi:hypothetical protein